jgi:hypothetical protein
MSVDGLGGAARLFPVEGSNKTKRKTNMSAKTIEINGVKMGKKGVRIAGKYTPVWYSHGPLVDGRVCVTIRSKSILKSLPAELGNVQNKTDMMTDYFEKDFVRFFEGTAEYLALLPLCI